MRNIFRNTLLAATFISCLTMSGCIEAEPMTETSANEEEVTLRLTAVLDDAAPETRLNYHEIGKSLKTTWSADDELTANAQPSTNSYVYTFSLKEGEGTGVGVFECTSRTAIYLPENLTSNGWIIYYPGSKIKCESDYLSLSYSNQVQKGNGNMDHLSGFHTIRLACTDGSEESATPFMNEFIDFSGDGHDESSCMRFNLSNLPSITPTEVSLTYQAPDGYSSNCFYSYNIIPRFYGSTQPNLSSSSKISIRLEDFGVCTEAKVYMMMSNYPVEMKAGGKLTISVKSQEGKLCTCSKTLKADATLQGGKLHNISGSAWTETESENIDGFDNPEDGIVVLQEATKGSGTDLIIMGDGFASSNFGKDGNYENVIRQAYADFFSTEPYKSLKEYFNVYYINAVSDEDHDAVPLTNGAIQGNASTVFKTKFTQNSTNISGDNDAVLNYAKQAIRYKGGKGGTPCSNESEVATRAGKSLMIVMVNVACHAGTCYLYWTTDTVNDFGNAQSIAYTSLNINSEARRWTTIHEAGGHGFGKLADEYEGYRYTSFSTSEWTKLTAMHGFGVSRNVNEHWDEIEDANFKYQIKWPYTKYYNVYWNDLLNDYGYDTSEGLGIYKGGNTFIHMYCRATSNSTMRDQFGTNGQFFNAISRWAIWYRLMRLTGSTQATEFKESLDEFIEFDRTLTITMTEPKVQTRSTDMTDLLPLAPPTMIEGRWEGPEFKVLEDAIIK